LHTQLAAGQAKRQRSSKMAIKELALWHYGSCRAEPGTTLNPDNPLNQTKSPDQSRGFSYNMVPETGVEPATYALRTQPNAPY